jgi:hypothetical protein
VLKQVPESGSAAHKEKIQSFGKPGLSVVDDFDRDGFLTLEFISTVSQW